MDYLDPGAQGESNGWDEAADPTRRGGALATTHLRGKELATLSTWVSMTLGHQTLFP